MAQSQRIFEPEPDPYEIDPNGRVARIIRRLKRLRDRVEPMTKGCIVIDFAGDRETIKVTEVVEDK